MKINPECALKSNKKFIVFSEKKAKITFNNKNEMEVVEVKIDGCQISNNEVEKCDYLLISDIHNYVELKGHKVSKALSQIKSTINILKTKTVAKKGYLVCNRFPKTTTELEIMRKNFSRKFNGKLIFTKSNNTFDIK